MARTLVTRRILARELVLNAATRPLNIAVPAGIVVAAFAFAWWLLPIAFVVYAALVVTTVLDGDVTRGHSSPASCRASTRRWST
jgi:phosphatidylglycerophosphate synthase